MKREKIKRDWLLVGGGTGHRRPRGYWSSVECPTCGALVGQPCHWLSDPSKKIAFHYPRRRLVEPGWDPLRPTRVGRPAVLYVGS